MKKVFISILCILCSISLSASDRVILTVASVASDATTYKHYTFAELDEGFEQHSFVTNTPWTDNAYSYSGPKLSDVLEANNVDMSGKFMLQALNDYRAELTEDMIQEAILAVRQDGKPMKIRHKGPIWVMLPLDDRPDLSQHHFYGQMVWQLKAIEYRGK